MPDTLPLIDTHDAFKRLIEAGVPDQQAETHVNLWREWSEHQFITREFLTAQLKDMRDYTDTRFEQIDERFAQIDQRFHQVDQRFEQIDQRFHQVDQRFEQIDQRFEQMDKRFEQRLEQTEQRLVRQIELRLAQQNAELKDWVNGRLIAVAGVSVAWVSALIVMMTFIS